MTNHNINHNHALGISNNINMNPAITLSDGTECASFTLSNEGELVIDADVGGSFKYATTILIEMILAGDNLKKHKKEYLDQILKLPNVQNDNLKAMKVFRRLQKLVVLLGE